MKDNRIFKFCRNLGLLGWTMIFYFALLVFVFVASGSKNGASDDFRRRDGVGTTYGTFTPGRQKEKAL